MSVSPQSRYASTGASVVRVPNANGMYNLTVLRTVPAAAAPYTLHIWRSGDRPDLVAAEALGNPLLWWAIFDINPEIIYPLSIPPGTVVRIPSAPVMAQGTLIQ
jgi:nucleoid-associated protein YgaU